MKKYIKLRLIFLKILRVIVARKRSGLYFFILLSFSLWLVSKLANFYETEITFSLNYTNVPSKYVVHKLEKKSFSAIVFGNGYNLIRYKYWNNLVNIDFSEIKNNNREMYLDLKAMKSKFQNYFPSDVTLKSIYPNFLFLNIEELSEKTIPIKLNIEIDFKQGFKIKDSIRLMPNSILLKAPRSLINEIHYIETETLMLEEVDKSYSGYLALNEPNKNVNFYPRSIKIDFEIEQIYEEVFLIPIKVVNFPVDKMIRLYPSSIKLLCKGSKKNIRKYLPVDFSVEFDFSLYENNKKPYITLVKKPNNLTNYKLFDNEIELLIKK